VAVRSVLVIRKSALYTPSMLHSVARSRRPFTFFCSIVQIVVTAIALGLSTAAAQQPPEPSTAPGSRPPGGQQVAALGRIEPLDGIIRLGAPTPLASSSGLLMHELHVLEGEDVLAGQLLATTDTAAVLEAAALEAHAGIELARREARAAHSRADQQCVLAEVRQREAERREALGDRGYVTEEETDRARADARLAAATCRSSRDEAAAVEAAITVAESAHRRALAERDRARIIAPVDARVLDIIAQPGERIGANGAIELARIDHMQAVAEVYEADLPRLRVGDPAEIRSPVLDRALTGRVRYIRPIVRKQDVIDTDPAARKDARIVEVEIRLDDPQVVAGLTNLQVRVLINP